MNKIILKPGFDKNSLFKEISKIMSQWRISNITLTGLNWKIFDYENKEYKNYIFEINPIDLKELIKIEDLRLDLIHFIEDLKDDTIYEYYLK